MDKIMIKNARFSCKIGVTEKERRKRQDIFVDAELFFNFKKIHDSLKNTINYSDVHNSIKKIAEKNEYRLIETLAEDIAKEILSCYKIKKIIVSVKKPRALASKNVEYVAVKIKRKKNG